MTSHINPILAGNNDAPSPFRGMPIGNQQRSFDYHNDFLTKSDYLVANWFVTTVQAGTGSATEAVSDTDIGGSLVLTNDDADNDRLNLQLAGGAITGGGSPAFAGETVQLTLGQRLAFACRFSVSDISDQNAFIGLFELDTNVFAPTKLGLGFRIRESQTDLEFLSISSASTVSVRNIIKAVADDQMMEVGFHWDGENRVFLYRRSVNQPDEWDLMATHTGTSIPTDTKLAITIANENAVAAITSMRIDYVTVMQERT